VPDARELAEKLSREKDPRKRREIREQLEKLKEQAFINKAKSGFGW